MSKNDLKICRFFEGNEKEKFTLSVHVFKEKREFLFKEIVRVLLNNYSNINALKTLTNNYIR
jgi:(p)ppGpp synthase/HD superfamily hydrolase